MPGLLWSGLLPGIIIVFGGSRSTLAVNQEPPNAYQCSRLAAGGTLEMNGFNIQFAQVLPQRNVGDESIFVIGDDMLTCQLRVVTPDGQTVFEHQAYRLDVNQVSGQDINHDDQPDAVVEAFSGGSHCCRTYFIVSLGREPGLITQIYTRNSTATFRDLDSDGNLEIL